MTNIPADVNVMPDAGPREDEAHADVGEARVPHKPVQPQRRRRTKPPAPELDETNNTVWI